MKRINCSRDKSVGQMLSEVTQAFCRATRRVLCCVPAARAREEELQKENKDHQTQQNIKLQSHGQMLSGENRAICPVILEKTGLAAENIALAAENATLAPQNVALAAENAALAPENIDLVAEITALTAEKVAVTAINAALTAEKGDQAPENIALAAEITALTAEKLALTAYSAGHVPEIDVLISETTALISEKIALVAHDSLLNARNNALKRQQNALCAALAEDNRAARAALEKEKITLTKKINPSALKLLQATFLLTNTEKSLETARAKAEDLETELEDLKMTLKVEQEARCKQREDLVNQIIETEEKLFIEQQEGKLTKQNTELQELALKADEKKANVKKQRKQEKKDQLEREKKEREELKKTEKKEKEVREELKKTEKKGWIERKKREKKEEEEREKLMKREKKEREKKEDEKEREKLMNREKEERSAALAAENAALRAENTILTAENVTLAAEIANLAAENVAQAAEIAALDAEIAALEAEIGVQAPAISFLVPEIATLTAEIAALTTKKAALTEVNCFLERQLDVLLAAQSEDNTAKSIALAEQKITLTKEMDSIALKLCRTTFDLTKGKNALETARARQEQLEQEIQDLKMTMKVEQEASLKQSEDMINQIIETKEKLLIEQRRCPSRAVALKGWNQGS